MYSLGNEWVNGHGVTGLETSFAVNVPQYYALKVKVCCSVNGKLPDDDQF